MSGTLPPDLSAAAATANRRTRFSSARYDAQLPLRHISLAPARAVRATRCHCAMPGRRVIDRRAQPRRMLRVMRYVSCRRD
jgi:hypothetical protein